MCGICGTYGFGDRELLVRMCAVLAHRGPDDRGFYVGAEVGLGMRRLSVIDMGGGRQPISNEDGTIQAVYNGEIYNFQELRAQLEKEGHVFRTRSDTEVLVHAYEQYGDGFVEKLHGMFAFALWDAKRRRLLLARDRIGIKPLYYSWHAGRLLFASEIKAILQSGCERRIDFLALHEYLSFAHVPAPRTIFKGIRKLLPAHALVCEGGKVRTWAYWYLRPPERRVLGWEEAKSKLRALLEQCVRERLIADVPVGAFLSGGVDSSAIVALMARHSRLPVRTFSLAFEKRAYRFDETEYARLVARRFGTEHMEVPVTVDAVEVLPQVIWHFDEPFANDTALVVFQLSREVRKHVTVVLAGTGGDEVFAGYNRYTGVRLAEIYALAPLCVREAIAVLAGRFLREHSDGRHLTRWLREFAAGGTQDPEDRYVGWMTYFSEEAKRELYTDMLRELTRARDAARGMRGYLRAYASRGRYGDAVFYADVKAYLPNDQLEYSEKMSMAHSLELRVPFCDHRLIEFAAALPLSMKTRGLRPKRLLKESLRGLIPEPVLKRRKLGLHAPVGIWLRTDLRPLLRTLLSGEVIRRRGYLRHDQVERLIQMHEAGRRDLSWQLWMLLVFELWHQMYLDGPGIRRELGHMTCRAVA